ncbi:hypothetical protein [Salinisphaera sp.]|uniref:hypothetical protein n=1 Tax=Salinisphaera sp. TaxID=1914330 RepID=UPI000C49A46A|nr:hypothetical protein [Salinisphaera sp.]MAS10884.1 hypothetical protein [Salinisphaera sp.]
MKMITTPSNTSRRLAGWLLGLVLGIGCVAASAVAAEIVYNDEQLARTGRVLCGQIDRFKDSSCKAFPIRDEFCQLIPEQCARDDICMGMGSVIRTTIARGLLGRPEQGRALGQLDADTIAAYERELPIVISKFATMSCPAPSNLGLPNVPFHQQHRNFIKRAIFTGQTIETFNQFLLKDFEYFENGKAKLSWDVNAVEYVDGEPETLLDYVDKVLGAGDNTFLNMERRGTVEDIRILLLSLGAVHARDLDCRHRGQIFCPLKSRARN